MGTREGLGASTCCRKGEGTACCDILSNTSRARHDGVSWLLLLYRDRA
ncbi:hypothetical protein Zm00014a_004596 [Zea mays]|uniref:Uncharacterized protein n=2 Tax=Zea mays TaxID=4577 RepID=A0A3L6GER7_MAIZE|nr:hypothetical protein Zm00014a_004597 [Zea mays]PWZ46510.1 hypothetical protein Zm00014a_004596 [Zea mays]